MVDISKVYMTGLGASPCLFVSVCVFFYIHVILYAYIIIYNLCMYVHIYIYIIHVLNKKYLPLSILSYGSQLYRYFQLILVSNAS